MVTFTCKCTIKFNGTIYVQIVLLKETDSATDSQKRPNNLKIEA